MEGPFLKFVHGQKILDVREAFFAKKLGKIVSGFVSKHETYNRKE